jgi:hypothetical protein
MSRSIAVHQEQTINGGLTLSLVMDAEFLIYPPDKCWNAPPTIRGDVLDDAFP